MRAVNDILWYAGTPIFFGVLFVGLGGVLWFDMPTNAPFAWAWHWLALPICIMTWAYALTQRDYFQRIRKVSGASFWFCTVAIAPLLILFSTGFVAILNCAYASSPSVTFAGPIRELHAGKSRYGDYHSATIRDLHSSQDIKLDISTSEFAQFKVGQIYRRDMEIGRLGLPFRRRP